MTDEAVLIGGSRIEPRVAFLKPLSGAISIGTGGSSLRARGGRTNVRALPVDASPEALGHVSRARPNPVVDDECRPVGVVRGGDVEALRAGRESRGSRS